MTKMQITYSNEKIKEIDITGTSITTDENFIRIQFNTQFVSYIPIKNIQRINIIGQKKEIK